MKKTSIIIILFMAIGCNIKVNTINKSKKNAEVNNKTDLSTYANEYFWSTLHNGDYSKIDSALYYLGAAYHENPNHLQRIQLNLKKEIPFIFLLTGFRINLVVKKAKSSSLQISKNYYFQSNQNRWKNSERSLMQLLKNGKEILNKLMMYV